MKITKIIAAATTAAVLTTGAVTVAGAASGGSTSDKPAATATANNHHPKRAALRRLIGRRGAVIAAKTIGIKPKVLVQEVKGGKTVGQVATDHGSTPTAVINALVAAGNKAVDNQVAKHHLTTDQAANIKAKLPTKVADFVNNWHPKSK